MVSLVRFNKSVDSVHDTVLPSFLPALLSKCFACFTPICKNIFDKIVSLILLPVVLPVIVFLWVLVRLDGGPGFFTQTRIGRGGHPFRCFKLRTMIIDADACLAAWYAENADLAADFKRDFKLVDDPRITPLGRFLRRTSLDELPQIFNVLKGDMSLVGPRPITYPEIIRYEQARAVGVYTAVKPGITGLWQISGRNALTYQNRIALDRQYYSEHTILLDIIILWRTLWLVLFSPNGL